MADFSAELFGDETAQSGTDFSSELFGEPKSTGPSLSERERRKRGFEPAQSPDISELGSQYGATARYTGAELAGLGTGLGEFVPGEIGRASAAGSRYLRGVKERAVEEYPGAAPVGTVLSLAAPFGAAARLVSRAPSALGRILGSAGVGGTLGAATPTGEEEYVDRLTGKIIPTAIGTTLGGGIGLGTEVIRRGINAAKFNALLKDKLSNVENLSEREVSDLQKAIAQNEAQIARLAPEQQRAARDAERAEALALRPVSSEAGAARQARSEAVEPQFETTLQSRARQGESPLGSTQYREREAALESTRNRYNAKAEELRRAGVKEQELQSQLGLLQRQEAETQAAVDRLGEELLARPGIDKAEFGQRARATLDSIYKKYDSARKEGSGFTKMVKDAGPDLRINTSGERDRLEEIAKTTRNPELRAIASSIQNELVNRDVAGKAIPRLTVNQLQEVKEYLDKILNSKNLVLDTGRAVQMDEKIKFQIQQVKDNLLKQASRDYPPYSVALGKYAELSRPLDFIERNLPIRKALTVDPISAQHKMESADVAGAILSQGQKNAPGEVPIIMEILIKESPGFQDSARLYFTRELFGKGQVPDKPAFDAFLFNNEGKLRASGLYDEFDSLARAQESAVNAVNDAKGIVSTGKEAITGAAASRRLLEQKLTLAEQLRGKAAKRAAPLEKAATEQRTRALGGIGEPAETVASRVSQAAKRAEERSKQISAQARSFGEQSKELQRSIDDLAKEVGVSEKQIADLQILRQKINSTPAESIGDAKKFYGDLLSAKKIDDATYTKVANELDQLQQYAREGKQVQNAMYAVMGSALGSALVTGALR